MRSIPNPAARPALAYRFGPYELDTARNELRKFGLRVKLERKPLQLLIALVEHPGETVVRGELRRSMWAEDLFVDFDNGLKVAVTKLRAALNDSAEKPRYVETVAAEGYRFIAEVEKITPEPTPAPALANVTKEAALGNSSQETSPRGYSPPEVSFHLWPSSVQRWKKWRRAAVFAGVAVIASVAIFAWRHFQQPMQVHAAKIMVVVLPFENLSGDPGQEYFSDGITEELSARLGNLNPQRLGVIGRTSAMAYKGSKRTIAEIGKGLSVDYVLEGSVRRDGNKVRVTAQLVSVPDQTHVWAEDYDRDFHGLLEVEDEVATDIARQVGVSVAHASPQTPSHPHSPSPEAHEDYLIAKYYWYKRTPEGWSKGREYFRRAVEKDPQYAAAYAGLAQMRIGRAESLAAARKAVEFDPTSAETWTALGWVLFFNEWDLSGAGDALKTAIRLDPNYASAHHIYSGVFEIAGRFQDAVNEEKQSVVLDPLAFIFRASLAETLSMAGEYDRAVEELKNILSIDARYAKAHETLGTVYLRKGNYKEAIAEYQLSQQYGGENLVGPLGYAYARSGDREHALRILGELERLQKRSPSGDVFNDLAMVETGLGDNDKAMQWLQKEYAWHDNDGPLGFNTDPVFAPLRVDPRFQEILRQMKFPS